jgi:hypothetical protein
LDDIPSVAPRDLRDFHRNALRRQNEVDTPAVRISMTKRSRNLRAPIYEAR